MTAKKGARVSDSVRFIRVTFESWIPQDAATTGAAELRYFILSAMMSAKMKEG